MAPRSVSSSLSLFVLIVVSRVGFLLAFGSLKGGELRHHQRNASTTHTVATSAVEWGKRSPWSGPSATTTLNRHGHDRKGFFRSPA